ncbi:hypothetical protein ACFV9W_24665 [Streptomyces sp. NPDC059897]|uniref:hypothetical protein n=1 Tax=Streptomyces sp. NPDC059897 TaxID=3346994 RepID=UPI00365829E8
MSIRLGKRLRTLLAAGTLNAGMFGGAPALAPSAAAWTYVGECSSSHKISYNLTSTQQIKIPDVRYQGYYNVRCWMDYGSTGEGVKALQLALKTCYGRAIAVDGLYGEQSFENLKWARYTQDGTRNGCAQRNF